MSRTKTAGALIVGVLSLLPLTYLAYYMAIRAMEVPHPGPPVIWTLHISAMVCSAALMLIYAWRIRKSNMDPERKMRWVHGVFWGNIFVFPWFWYRLYWRDIGKP